MFLWSEVMKQKEVPIEKLEQKKEPKSSILSSKMALRMFTRRKTQNPNQSIFFRAIPHSHQLYYYIKKFLYIFSDSDYI